MNSHESAKPSHYDEDAEFYDLLNEEDSAFTNQLIEQTLKEHKIKTVLDFTCGTGSQVVWLTKRGCEVVGVDLNSKMLDVAKQKTNTTLLQGDMRTSKVGKFDAIITIFNAIGHLTKQDFEKAIQNIRENLNDGGIYIFDIFNLTYLLEGDNIANLTIDWQKKLGDTNVRKIQYSTINQEGILASYTTSITGEKVLESSQTLQVYSANQLEEMLRKNGFSVLRQCGMDGSKFSDKEIDRILMVAQKG